MTEPDSPRSPPQAGGTPTSGRSGPHRHEAGAGPTEWGVPTSGVGPWVGPPPDDPRYDPALLRDGDTRNVVDAYRYWTREAIIADIDKRRHPLHVAIENFGHDANIGGVVRTANAFAVDTVHIVGRRRWNRRGAMVTDRYQRLRHHDSVADLLSFAAEAGVSVVAVDNLPGVQNEDLIGDVAGRGDVVGDVEHCQVETFAQLSEQAEDLQADGHVQHRHRLVREQHAGLDSQGTGDGDPLTLPAGKLVRVPVQDGGKIGSVGRG